MSCIFKWIYHVYPWIYMVYVFEYICMVYPSIYHTYTIHIPYICSRSTYVWYIPYIYHTYTKNRGSRRYRESSHDRDRHGVQVTPYIGYRVIHDIVVTFTELRYRNLYRYIRNWQSKTTISQLANNPDVENSVKPLLTPDKWTNAKYAEVIS